MRKYGYAYCDRSKVDALLAHVQQEGAALADPTGARAGCPCVRAMHAPAACQPASSPPLATAPLLADSPPLPRSLPLPRLAPAGSGTLSRELKALRQHLYKLRDMERAAANGRPEAAGELELA